MLDRHHTVILANPIAVDMLGEPLLNMNFLSVIGEVQTLYEQLKSEDEGVVDALIASAYPLEDQELEKIVALLKHFGGVR